MGEPGARGGVTRARERRRQQPPTDDAIAQRFSVDVARTIEQRGLLHGGESCVVAVSGGPDSMALLHVLVRLRERFSLRLHVAHLDHAVRPGSAADAEFVAAQAQALGMDITTGVLDVPRPKDRSPEEHLGLERDRFLARVANEVGAARILTGHTLDDQAETVLGNLLTGSGRRGLGGMPPARWRVARPLIDRTRVETEAFCAALGLEPRIDETNRDLAFRRNRLRHEVLPVLGEVNPRISEHLAQLADVARSEDYLLDALASREVRIEERDSGTSLVIADLLKAPIALQRRAIRLLARNENLGLTFAQCDSLLRVAREGREGATIALDGPLSAWREAGLLTIGRAGADERREA